MTAPRFETLVEHPCFPNLKRRLIDWTGLAYYQTREQDLAAIIQRRLTELRIRDCFQYFSLITGEDASASAERDALISQLTIGETYFFRDPDQFATIRELVLPAIINRNRSERRLRIWSAGCSTGAEPYSLAIMLDRELSHELTGWSVRIWGTDINRNFLARAATGRFTEWDFRSMPEDLKKLCFQPWEAGWEISPKYRQSVSFDHHNLVSDPYPESAFDLILCRNVAIYFSSEIARRVLAQFSESLTESGWLIPGHVEGAGEDFGAFQRIQSAGATLYQKRRTEPFAPGPRVNVTPRAAALPAARPTRETPPARGINGRLAKAQQDKPSEPDRTSHPPEINELRRLADRGDWENAVRYGRALTEKWSQNPVVHFYFALILESLGIMGEAERLLRQSIRLDDRFVLAHYHLALVVRENARESAQFFKRASKLLAQMQDDQLVPEADGITVADLRNAIDLSVGALDSCTSAKGIVRAR